METRYKVVTEGKLRDGVDPEQFVSSFVQTFKIPEDQARKLLTAGKPITLKDNLDRDTAEKFRRVLSEQIGLEVRVEANAEQGRASFESMTVEGQPEKPAASASGQQCPKCGSDRVVDDECLACGIIISKYLARQAQTAEETPSVYAPPASNVLPEKEELDDSEFSLRKVELGQGWQWIVGGWELFVRNPIAWIVAIILWYIILIIGNLIPFVGSLGMNILSPIFIAGLMLGAQEQRRNGDFTVGHLFAGFSTEFGKLVQAGLLYLVAGLVVSGIIMGLVFVTGVSAMTHHAQAIANDPGQLIVNMMIIFLVVLVVIALISMAFWYVPLLVVFDGVAPIQAVGMSFSACMKNAIPFLIYGLIGFGLALVAMIPIGLGLLVLAPVMTASIYVSYRDIFHGDG